jgi:type I restriction enzyme S subunit
LRQTVRGRDVKTKRQYRVRAGQFVYSRIDARHGAFGLVPSELDGAIVSGDFPVFDVNTDVVNPRYVAYMVQARRFVAQLKDPSRGVTNRQRLSEAVLLSLEIPWTSDPQRQLRIVQTIDAVARRVSEVRQLRALILDEQEEMLRAYARQLATSADRRPLREVAPLVRRAVEIDEATFYPELGIRSFGRGTFHKPPILGKTLGSKRLYRIEPGDLVFNNVFAWEGAIAVAQAGDAGRHGSHRFLTCVANPDLATPEFLRAWFLTDEGMSHVLAASPGAAGRNRTLGLKKLMKVPVPTPPIDDQRRLTEITKRVDAARLVQASADKSLEEVMPAVLDLAFTGHLKLIERYEDVLAAEVRPGTGRSESLAAFVDAEQAHA